MKFPLLLLSHLALGLAGWAITREFRYVSAPELADNTHTRSARTRPPKTPASELVRSIESRLEKDKNSTAQPTNSPRSSEMILRAFTGLTLPADPAAAIGKLLATDGESASLQAAEIFVLWAKKEPASALQFAASNADFNKIPCDDEVLELVGESIAPEYALAMPESQKRDPLFAGFARQLIASRTVEQLVVLLIELEGSLKSSLSHHLVTQWPAERLDDYGRLATAMNEPEMLGRLWGKLPKEELARWMMRYIDEHPNPKFARSVQEGSTFFCLMRDQPGISLEERLKRIVKRPVYEHQAPEAARKDAVEFLAKNDVSDFFNNDGPDLRYAFHHGKIEASEIHAKLTARFPEYAAAGLLPALLHQQLTSEDPKRAAFLIADLPAADQARIIVESAWSISTLDTLGLVLVHFPDSDDEVILASRQEFWKAVTDDGLDHYGEDYLRWINRVLEPKDRKMALEAIADRIDGSMDFKAKEIREIIGDVQLRDDP